jgi:transcription elongation GreA/GreB family factor
LVTLRRNPIREILLAMSRAFVKEDLEPAPPLRRRISPSSPDALSPLTLSGANRLREELKRLRAASGSTSRVNHESAERLVLLEEVMGRAEIVDVRTLAGDQIRFGATVVLRDVDSDTRARYQIVGALEADPKHGRISVTAPLAQALIGREVGDSVQVQTPSGEREYEVLELLWVKD